MSTAKEVLHTHTHTYIYTNNNFIVVIKISLLYKNEMKSNNSQPTFTKWHNTKWARIHT